VPLVAAGGGETLCGMQQTGISKEIIQSDQIREYADGMDRESVRRLKSGLDNSMMKRVQQFPCKRLEALLQYDGMIHLTESRRIS